MALGNQTFTAPKISRSNISSPLSSGASRISGVTPRLKSTSINFRSSGIGRSSLVSSQSSVETTLAETNQILVEIQNQLALDFALRNAEEKQKNQEIKKEKSRRRFALREGAVESIKKIGGAIKQTASFVATPVKGFFDKMLEFVSLLGLGIGTNAVFTWFADEENREKIGKFFKILTTNWKLVRNILTSLVAIWAGAKIVSLISLLANPVFLSAIGAVLAAVAVMDLMPKPTAEYDQTTGEKAVYNNPAYGDENFVVQESWLSNIIDRDQNSKERKQSRARSAIQLIEGINRGKDYTNWDPAAQKRYDQAITFLELDKGKMLNRLSSLEEGSSVALPDNLDAFRAMGGPVESGKAYVVGEKGPEIFAPNVNGSVVNNYRTEKIYEMISSKGAGKINYITMDLPPIDARTPKSSSIPKAPEIPAVSPVNVSNPYMSVTPGIYGIYV